MSTERNDQDRELRELESALGAELRRSLEVSPVEPPARVDAAVADMTRLRSDEVRRQLAARRARRWPVWTAAAAAALLVVASLWTATVLRHGGRERQVDIVDAYRLARQVESGGRLDPSSDANGDGRIDRADVDELIRRAVAVRKAGD